MGRIRSPKQALLFIGTLYSDPGISDHSREIIGKNFGEILFSSHALPWDYSAYYKKELGCPLFRRFIFFKNLFDSGTLADVKLKTNEIEDLLSSEGKRRINLDPGYLTPAKIVLASTKNYAHRIYLGKGIYGEVTLIYKDKDGIYKPQLYTYRDYQDKTYVEIFMSARELLRKKSG